MGISTRLLVNKVSIYRLSNVDANRTDTVQVASDISCMIVPFDDKETALTEEAQGQEYIIYADINSGIRTGDTCVDENNNTYEIGGISKLEYGRRLSHYERITATRVKPTESV